MPSSSIARDVESKCLVTENLNGVHSPMNMRHKKVLAAGCMTIAGVVSGTYVTLQLLAAFERDASLGWTPQSTTHLTVAATASEVFGLFLIGPIADYTSPPTLFMINSIVVCLCILAVSTSGTVHLITMGMCAAAAAKGLLWPSFGALVAANIPAHNLDFCFLLAAISSRCGSLMTNLLLGGLIMTFQWSWRNALLVVFGLDASLLLGACMLMPSDIAETVCGTPSEVSLVHKWSRLAQCLNGWLALLTVLGCYSCWALGNYLSVLAKDTYGLSAGTATTIEATFASGCLLGLLSGSAVSGMLSLRAARITQVLQVAMAVTALVLLASTHVPLRKASFLWMIVGFGFAVASYVPYLAYAASSPSSERGFRLSAIDGLALIYSVFLSYQFGKIRERQGAQAFSSLHYTCAASLGVAAIAMFTLYWRLGLKR